MSSEVKLNNKAKHILTPSMLKEINDTYLGDFDTNASPEEFILSLITDDKNYHNFTDVSGLTVYLIYRDYKYIRLCFYEPGWNESTISYDDGTETNYGSARQDLYFPMRNVEVIDGDITYSNDKDKVYADFITMMFNTDKWSWEEDPCLPYEPDVIVYFDK